MFVMHVKLRYQLGGNLGGYYLLSFTLFSESHQLKNVRKRKKKEFFQIFYSPTGGGSTINSPIGYSLRISLNEMLAAIIFLSPLLIRFETAL
jgi:hypothetical protein